MKFKAKKSTFSEVLEAYLCMSLATFLHLSVFSVCYFSLFYFILHSKYWKFNRSPYLRLLKWLYFLIYRRNILKFWQDCTNSAKKQNVARRRLDIMIFLLFAGFSGADEVDGSRRIWFLKHYSRSHSICLEN